MSSGPSLLAMPALRRVLALLTMTSALGCQKFKDKKELTAVAEGISTSIVELRSIDRDLIEHLEASRAVPAELRFERVAKLRAVVADNQKAKKATDLLVKRITTDNGKTISGVHEINVVHIAASAYSLAANCVDPHLGIGVLGMPKEAECLQNCEIAWGKLVSATAELSAAAKAFEVDIPAIRGR